MFKIPLFTYDLAKGLSSLWDCAMTSSSKPEPPDRGILPRLGAFSSQPSEAALFLPWGEMMSASPSLLSSEEGALISPDTVCGVPSGWKPPLAPPLSSFSSSTGAWYGAGTSILISRGLAGSSGSGAGHRIYSAFLIQTCKGMDYLAPLPRVVEAYWCSEFLEFTSEDGWLQSRPVSSEDLGHDFCFLKSSFLSE